MSDDGRDDFPISGATPQTPILPTPILKVSLGSICLGIFSRPSAWLAAGMLGLLILEVCLLAMHIIPADQLPIFKDIEVGTMVLFGSMVHSVFHGDQK